MKYRLLVDLDAITVLDSLPRRVRARLLDHFTALRSSPDLHSQSHQHDATGRRVEISVFAGFAIHYWIDFPDRHVKVLAIRLADR